MNKKVLTLLVAGGFMLGLGATANAETLELLTWKGYAPKSLVEKFEKETGITVKTTFSNNEEMIAKLRATRGAGFDLAQPSQDRISSVQEKFSIYQPIDYSMIDAKLIVPSMLDAVKKNTMVDGKSYGVPHVFGTSGLIVNKKAAPDADEMVVRRHVRVEPQPFPAVAQNVDEALPGQGLQVPVNRVEGDGGDPFPDPAIDGFGIRMGLGGSDLPKDLQPLMSDFDASPAAGLLKIRQTSLDCS